MAAAVGSVQDDFREAMRRLATTVSIVTVQDGAERHGTTATAVTSVCMEPPSILVCINRDSRLHAFMRTQDRFCVNLLHVDNLATARLFSSPLPGPERFAGGDWQHDAFGVPFLADAQANLFCMKETQIDHGMHTIFIGRVTRARSRPDISALIYADGSYAACAALEAPAPAQANQPARQI